MIGDLLVSLRKQKGLTQVELGTRIGMTQSQVCLIEKKGTDKISVVKVFAGYYGIDWLELLRMEAECG